MSHDITVRQFRPADYVITLREMQTFTAQRDDSTPDEIWLVEHPPVFTQGLAGKDEHVLDPGEIPVIKTERGGQVTYHGPGQVVAYLLLDIKRRRLGIRDLVCRIEQAVIKHLSSQSVPAQRKAGAPGVYIAPPNVLAGSKIASLGLKVSRGRTFHGVALNVAMNLNAFDRINPCGVAGLKVTDLQTLVGPVNVAEQASRLGNILVTTIQD